MRPHLSLIITLMFPITAFADGIPPNVPTTVGNRIFFGDTSTYNPVYALGKIVVLDTAMQRTTDVLDKSHFLCDPSIAAKSKVSELPNTRAYYFVLDKSYSGSLSFFTANASMSDDQRQQITLDDIASVDLDQNCQLGAKQVYKVVIGLPNSAGKKIFYITGVTMSHLNKEIFSKDTSGGGLSAGSWLSVGGSNYKGSQQIDAVPVMAVRGYAIDVPAAAKSTSVLKPQDITKNVSTFNAVGFRAGLVIKLSR